MMTVLFVAGYIAIAALCVYLEGRLSGESDYAPLWIVWPLMLPCVIIAVVCGYLGDLGSRHHGA